ncbi:MAG: YIP1 family protein [Bosea sp. (in: a-proteobacteria)]
MTGDILGTWRRPRDILRAKLANGTRDDRALATLLGACGLIFIAQWPALSRAAALDPSVPLEARISGALLATVFILPPALYLVAAVSHLIARALGGKGSHFGARLALFWALLCTAPLMLLNGLVVGFLGQGLQATSVGLAVLAAFLWLWLTLLREAERG